MKDNREIPGAATPVSVLDNAALFQRSCERMRERATRDSEITRSMVSVHACNSMLHDCADSIDFLMSACEFYRDRPALGVRTERVNARGEREPLDTFTSISYGELWTRITACAAGLERLDIVRSGDRVGIVGFAGIDYVVAQYGAWYLGAVIVPLPTTLAVEELAALVERANLRTLILDEEALTSAAELSRLCASVEAMVAMDSAVLPAQIPGGPASVLLEHVVELGRTLSVPRRLRAPVGEDPVRMLLHTSGSTGLPKAAQLTEAALTTYWRKAVSDFRGDPSAGQQVPRVNIGLAFMPMNHVRGQLNVLEAIAQGGLLNFTYRRDLSTLFDDIRLARPTVIILVPRVAQAIYTRFQRDLADFVRAGNEEKAARVTLEARMRGTFLGDRLWLMRIGSAPVSDEMLQFLRRTFDVPVHTGYGSTEAGMIFADDRILSANVLALRLDDVPELGYASTDQPYPRGELLIRSRCMTIGYAGVDNADSGLFDADGFLRTGDIFEQRSDNHYVWLGRKNNILKLAHGEFVSPWRLESLYASDSAAILQIFVYVNSLHAHVMAVAVPDPEWAAALRGTHGQDASGQIAIAIEAELRRIAAESGLRSYELPVDFMLEYEPFSTHNGFLTESGKLSRKRLEARYGPVLDARYVHEESARRAAVDALRGQRDLPLEERVMLAMQIVLNLEHTHGLFECNFRDHGGDSLDATELSALLEELSGIEIPPGMILDPRKDALQVLSRYVTGSADDPRVSTRYRAVHGNGTTVTAAQLRVAPFFTGLVPAANMDHAPPTPQRILLTGANGFLGRVLLRELLDTTHMSRRVVCLVRAESDEAAIQRLLHECATNEGTGEQHLLTDALASGRLTVRAGDLAQSDLGLERSTWDTLAETLDAIVHNGALVNHAFSYSQLYAPNVLGVVEVARLALTRKLKTVNFVSSIAVADLQIHHEPVSETMPAAELQPSVAVRDEYGNGYALSKWAAEVVLARAHEEFGLPVRIFRCGMLLPDTGVRNQANADDFLARLLLSLVTTNMAPASFYQTGANPLDTRSFYGLPVNHVARFIAALGWQAAPGTEAFHVVNRHGESASLDQIVEWLVDEGFPLERLGDHAHWFGQFSAALQRLEPTWRNRTSLPIVHQWKMPLNTAAQNRFDTFAFEQRFAQLSTLIDLPSRVPYVSRDDVRRYISDLGLTGMQQVRELCRVSTE